MSSQNSIHNAPARVLHWIMAVLILLVLFLGVIAVSISSADRQVLLLAHKTLGVAILALGIVRLAWAFIGPAPAPLEGEPLCRRRIAAATHFLFYALMIGMPLIGWAMLSAGGYPVAIWGGLHLPAIAPQNGELHAVLRLMHRLCGYGLYGLFALHVAAALFHALILGDGALRRMGIGVVASSRE